MEQPATVCSHSISSTTTDHGDDLSARVVTDAISETAAAAASIRASRTLHVVLFRVTEQWFGEVADALERALCGMSHVTYETRTEHDLHLLGTTRAAQRRPAIAAASGSTDTDVLHLLAMLPNSAPPAALRSATVRVVAWYWEQPTSQFIVAHRDWFALLHRLYVPWPWMCAAEQRALFAASTTPVRLLAYGPPTRDLTTTTTTTSKSRRTQHKYIDVLFFGTANAHRQHLEAMLRAALPDRVVQFCYNNVWGEQREVLVRAARIVLNLHYYDAALLEVHRIVPLLRAGVCVLSERSADTQLDAQYERLGAVQFAATSDEIVSRCRELLCNGAWRTQATAARRAYAQLSPLDAQLRAQWCTDGLLAQTHTSETTL